MRRRTTALEICRKRFLDEYRDNELPIIYEDIGKNRYPIDRGVGYGKADRGWNPLILSDTSQLLIVSLEEQTKDKVRDRKSFVATAEAGADESLITVTRVAQPGSFVAALGLSFRQLPSSPSLSSRLPFGDEPT